LPEKIKENSAFQLLNSFIIFKTHQFAKSRFFSDDGNAKKRVASSHDAVALLSEAYSRA